MLTPVPSIQGDPAKHCITASSVLRAGRYPIKKLDLHFWPPGNAAGRNLFTHLIWVSAKKARRRIGLGAEVTESC